MFVRLKHRFLILLDENFNEHVRIWWDVREEYLFNLTMLIKIDGIVIPFFQKCILNCFTAQKNTSRHTNQ
jgi:hypothetical protein